MCDHGLQLNTGAQNDVGVHGPCRRPVGTDLNDEWIYDGVFRRRRQQTAGVTGHMTQLSSLA